MPTSLHDAIHRDERLALFRAMRDAGHLPYFRVAESAMSPTAMVEGRKKLMLASNNYLSLADHPDVIGAAQDAIESYGTASTGSRLLNGTFDLHVELEREIADWHGTEDAIVLTTGYQTNIGTIGGLVDTGDIVIVDERVHASIHDACRLARADMAQFAHNDVDDLKTQLERFATVEGSVLVVVDSLYSMEGDIAPLDDIAELCGEFGAAFMVDEAHSVGLFGAEMTGLAELFGVADKIDIRMASFSKAIGSTGGFVAGSHDIVDAIRGRARPFLFSTSGSPATLGAALAAIRLQRGKSGPFRANETLRNAALLKEALNANGVQTAPDSQVHGVAVNGPIVAVPVGDDVRAMQVWKELFDRDVFISVALYPAVPRSGALLRICVSAAHDAADLERAAGEIARAFQLVQV